MHTVIVIQPIMGLGIVRIVGYDHVATADCAMLAASSVIRAQSARVISFGIAIHAGREAASRHILAQLPSQLISLVRLSGLGSHKFTIAMRRKKLETSDRGRKRLKMSSMVLIKQDRSSESHAWQWKILQR